MIAWNSILIKYVHRLALLLCNISQLQRLRDKALFISSLYLVTSPVSTVGVYRVGAIVLVQGDVKWGIIKQNR